ncbi:DUF5086 domain-containing protein [Providencia rettgeri]|uniref:DUF5086 domain-containing protein n=1 Tax=Providencia rettgeri TaxID=587 RepID=UPI00206F0A47|nr:DUF5086 domain-containing protein [Providencia rettgeri]
MTDKQSLPWQLEELRDKFAMAALNAVIIGIYNDAATQGVYHNWSEDEFATEAYKLADAMLKARG